MIKTISCLLLLLSTAVFGTVYLPGVVPNTFKDEEKVRFRFDANISFLFLGLFSYIFQVNLKANKVTSTKTQLPYDYYDLPFCKSKHRSSKADNVGGRLSGDTATTSPYEVFFLNVILKGHDCFCAAAHEKR